MRILLLLPILQIKNKMIILYKKIVNMVNSNSLILKKRVLVNNINSHYNKTMTSFTFPFILNLFGVEIPDTNEPILGFAFSVFTLCLITLISFINILGYFASIYFINKYNVNSIFINYPWIIKILKYYEKSTLFIIIVEIIFILLSLIFLILLSLVILDIIII